MATFPTLGAQEVLVNLNDIGCPIPPDFDIDRPNTKPCVQIYAWFWEDLTAIPFDLTKAGVDAYMQDVLEGTEQQGMHSEGVLLGLQYETL